MNRREFLQSIAAFVTSAAFPLDGIATVPESAIDQLWAAAQDNPVFFYVNEYGALTSDAVETYPATRKELLDYQEVSTRDELLSFARDHSAGADFLECEHSDPRWFFAEESVPEDWEEWLATAYDDTVSTLIKMIHEGSGQCDVLGPRHALWQTLGAEQSRTPPR